MKALILTAILAIILVSCNHKNKETENNSSINSNEKFSCPMHSEVIGKKGEERKITQNAVDPLTHFNFS
mgnify:CR=1 FL=1